MTQRMWMLLDAVYAVALAFYVLAGVPLTPFHGDESMQIYMSSDYTTAIVNGRWSDLLTQPPYDIDSDGHLRLINGTVNRYAIGAALQLGGYAMTLPRPGWDWGLDYARNVETGHRLSDSALEAARLPSALFTALSVGVMFVIGRHIGGRPAAYIATAIYALNPALLLNGRRATQEGSMFFFGLLTVLIAVWLSRREKRPLWGWALLTLAGGLTLASKHSGVVFIAAALGWIGLEALIRLLKPHPPTPSPLGEGNVYPSPPTPLPRKRGEGRRFIGTVIALVVSGVLMAALFVALSPALWNDPAARGVNLLEERARLLDIQVSIAGGALSFTDRIEAILLQPTVRPVMYYELASWSEIEPIQAEVVRYETSFWRGYPNGTLGVLILVLVGVGVVVALARAGRSAGLLWWFGLTLITLLVNPLAWQRYYLPLIPVLAALAGLGGATLIRAHPRSNN
ncbi:MAG: glycosyltransferase family 39 protein [Anaerolineae bacterium]|nr:glycosyltransferase family 39 protein [Anaerolineae bacterium]